MKTPRNIQRKIRFLHRDGISTKFPVSNFVLNLGRTSRRQHATNTTNRWRPTFVQQTASLALTLVLCVSSFGITYGNPLNTLSYLRDIEISHDNLLAAGLLAFRLNPGDVTIPIREGDHIPLAPLFEPHPDALAIKYRVHAKIIGDETPLCTLLNATGTSSPYIYNGALADLITQPATTTGHGHLEVTLPNGAGIANGTACTIALIYDGWHVDAPEKTGYTDRKEDRFTFVYDAPEQELPDELIESASQENTDTATTTEEKVDEPETPSAPPEETPQVVTETASSTQSTESKETPENNDPTTARASTTPPIDTVDVTDTIDETNDATSSSGTTTVNTN